MISLLQKESKDRFGLFVNNSKINYPASHTLRMYPALVEFVRAPEQPEGAVQYNLLGSGLAHGIMFSLNSVDLSDHTMYGLPSGWEHEKALGKTIVADHTGIQVWVRPDSVVLVGDKRGVSEIAPGSNPFELEKLVITNNRQK